MFKSLRNFCERFLFFQNNDTIQFISQEQMQTKVWFWILGELYFCTVKKKKKKKKSVDFTVKYLASRCQFFYRYFYGRLPVEHFRNKDMAGLC